MPAANRRAISADRKPTNVSLDAELVRGARELGINVSRACEDGLAAEVKRLREERWQIENAEAIRAWNEWVSKNGLPLGSLF